MRQGRVGLAGRAEGPHYASLGTVVARPTRQRSVRPRHGSLAPYCPAAPRQGRALRVALRSIALHSIPLRASLDEAPRLGSNGMREPDGAGRTAPVAWTRRLLARHWH